MRTKNGSYTESGLKLLGLDLASLVTQGVGAGAQPNAYTGYGIFPLLEHFVKMFL